MIRVPHCEVERLDRELTSLSRSAGALRLAVGEALQGLTSANGHFELGFPSLEAYALERCERSGRWAAESASVATRLTRLPSARRALIAGTISWSAAQLLASKVEPKQEASWVELARRVSYRALRKELGAAHARESGQHSESDPADQSPPVEQPDPMEQADCALTVTMDIDEAWLFESTRMLMARIAGERLDQDQLVQCLCAEALGTLVEQGSKRATALPEPDPHREAAAKWRQQLAEWRKEAEERCEARGFRHAGAVEAGCELVAGTDAGGAPVRRSLSELDAGIRALCARLVERELRLGALAQDFRRADGHRRLGYASESQYARERLGISLSSLKSYRTLALRAALLPELREAVALGEVGYEAAHLVSLIATRATVSAWLHRAQERTVKHLREEVAFAELIARFSTKRDQLPPTEAEVDELQRLESRVKSGAVWFEPRETTQHGQMSGASLAAGVPGDAGEGASSDEAAGSDEWPRVFRRRLLRDLRLAGAERGMGRVTYRFRVSRETQDFYRDLEQAYLKWRRSRQSFVQFVCASAWQTWCHALLEGEDVAYAHIYARDRYVCASPVCSRHGVTPHHLRFRSRGGDDSEDNVVSLCVWCHLEGVHGGRITAEPPAYDITWTLGRDRGIVVRGRRKVAA